MVLDLDTHPAALAATAYLRRVPARLLTGRHGPRVRLLTFSPERRTRRAASRSGTGVDLILARLPKGAQLLTRHGAATAMTAWRPLLRPGGFLLVGLTTAPPQPGGFSHRATVIAAACAAAGVRQSMSAVGNSADNAAAESFNATFKRETRQGRRAFTDEREARLTSFRWLHRYNTLRRHSGSDTRPRTPTNSSE
ncbi:integrase core domain-containing protein [Plantactinospora sp. DSM 117369]